MPLTITGDVLDREIPLACPCRRAGPPPSVEVKDDEVASVFFVHADSACLWEQSAADVWRVAMRCPL